MKKLNKNMKKNRNTIESFGCVCGCGCPCSYCAATWLSQHNADASRVVISNDIFYLLWFMLCCMFLSFDLMIILWFWYFLNKGSVLYACFQSPHKCDHHQTLRPVSTALPLLSLS